MLLLAPDPIAGVNGHDHEELAGLDGTGPSDLHRHDGRDALERADGRPLGEGHQPAEPDAVVGVLVGSESEVSGGSYDEAAPASVTNTTAGESVVFWMKTMNLVNTGSYKGSVVPGTYRGKELWLQRLK